MNSKKALGGLGFVIAMAVIGCGGGGGGTGGTGLTAGTTATTATTSGDTSGGGSKIPTAQTKSRVDSNLSAYLLSVVGSSFTAFGPKTHAVGAFYDVALGLWGTVQISPSGLLESLYVDQGKTTPAGSLKYTVNEVAFVFTGPIEVNAGRYAGLTGNYFEAIQSDGFNGSINYGMPDGSTVVTSFAVQNDDFGHIFGTATAGVALAGDYTQNQQVTYNTDGSSKVTTLDGNMYRSTFNFAADLSGTGQITGSDPGLPATVTWNGSGNGTVKFADNSTLVFTGWHLEI